METKTLWKEKGDPKSYVKSDPNFEGGNFEVEDWFLLAVTFLGKVWRIFTHHTENNVLQHCELDPYKPRILVLNYPSNPHGQRYNEDELREIAEVCREFQVTARN